MALIDGFPQSEGARVGSLIVKTGPTSYTTVTTGSTPTGGQSIEAVEFGMKYIDHIAPALSDDGQYIVYFTPAVSGGVPVTSGILMWCTAAGGAEVAGSTNLSGRTVRLRAIGR